MKSIYLNYQPWKKLCCFLLLLNAIACNKNNSALIYYGSASMLVNGVLWETDKIRCGSNTNCYKGKLGMEIEKFNSLGEKRESYSFEEFATAAGIQKMFPLSTSNSCNDTLETTYFTLQDDGDVIQNFYDADASSDNYLKVESYNASTKDISGSFAATYILVKMTALDSLAVDTIRITNGKFSTKILN